MARGSDAVALAGGVLGPERHVCALFDSRDEEYRILLPFVREGLEQGEKAIHIVDPGLRDEHLARLGDAGIDVARAQAGGQLELLDWHGTYLRGGRFDRRAMAVLVEGMLSRARREGFPRARVVAHMEWALEGSCDPTTLVDYEARMNDVLAGYDDPVVCTYDRARFAAGTAMDVLRAHARVILDGALQENLSFLPHAKLMPRVRGRALTVLRERYLAALLTGACREALEIAVEDALWRDVPVSSLYLEVVQPAQYEIGRLWRAKRIGIAQVHLATELSRAVLAHLHAFLPCEPSTGKRVVVACVEGELHDLGARMVADFLEIAGFDVRFLGANVPATSLAEFVRERPPDLLALSATTSANLTGVRRTVVAVRRVLGDRVPLAVGGQVFQRRPALGRQLGVDLHAGDARDILAAADRVSGR
jgi:methanogenic corrinoid protein MtbC1